MKKILAFTLLLAGIAVSSYAQQPASPGKEVPKEERKKIRDDLNLTKEQSNEVKAINDKFKEEAKVVKEDESLSKEQKREKFKALNTERENKLKTTLTPEQQQKMSEYKKHGHRKGQRPTATK